MQYLALATDFDETIADHGVVAASTLDALVQIRSTGRKTIMVTGRRLEDLLAVFDHPHLFDIIVAENGALLYWPETRSERVISEPSPEPLLNRLRSQGVPISVGRAIIASVVPHEQEIIAAIQSLGLEWHVIFNKGSVMALPSGVNKATGLTAALLALGIAPENVVGVGDAENDHAFLAVCGCSVAVANALAALKHRADIVTIGSRGSGVEEIIARLVRDDLANYQHKS